MRPMLGIRIVVLAAVVAATTLISAGVASAHVSVVPSSLPKGGFEILSFSVPNEEEDANTVVGRGHRPDQVPDRVREREADDRVDDHHREDHAGRSR